MMLLADTSVWSLALRRSHGAALNAIEEGLRDELAEAIRIGGVVMVGPIRQELLSGIREQSQFEKLRVALQAFRDESLETSDYEEAARLYNACRGRGMECGPMDMLLLAVASRRKWKISTNDNAMKRCLEATASLSA